MPGGVLALDIETIPLPAYWDAADATCKEVEAATGSPPGFHPTTAMVVSVAFGWFANTQHGWQQRTEVRSWRTYESESEGVPGKAEMALLGYALGRLKGASGKDTRLLTFAGKSFDLNILRWRAALQHVQAPPLPWKKWLYPFDWSDHCDLRLVLGNGKLYAKGTQSTWAEAFGVPAEDRGAEVLTMVREGRWDDLEQYNAGDATTLLNLYERIEALL